MPLPPPPPPGPPPPPAFVPAAQPAVSAEGRNLLLHSIRQGTSLKKTVTNDKSGPVIQGAVRPSSNDGGSPRGIGSINGSATLGRNNGLAGLFAHGMPRLKPTGVDIGQNNSQSLTSLPSATAGKPEQTRRQFNVDIKNRGPPPKPPPANLKPTMPQSTSDSVLTGPLHSRSNSTTSLNNNSSWTQPLPKAPPGGYGKPNVAPKPPGIAAKSPGKLVNGRTSVTRAQSMRAPRTPPAAPPQCQIPLLPNQSELHRGAVFHQSQDSILHTPPPPKHHTLPSPRTAPPSRPPLRPPQTRPPPPPPNRVVMSSPPCPPPPPPTQAPPPPPHRVPLQNHRPPVTPMHLSPVPPPPPARHSSVRNGSIHQTYSSKLEARFVEKFHVKEEFPPPQPFLGINKVYNSRASKQPAPQPPQHVQLHWPRDNSSTC